MSTVQARHYLEKLDANEDFRREVVPLATPVKSIPRKAYVDHGKSDGFVFTVEEFEAAVAEMEEKFEKTPMTITKNGVRVLVEKKA